MMPKVDVGAAKLTKYLHDGKRAESGNAENQQDRRGEDGHAAQYAFLVENRMTAIMNTMIGIRTKNASSKPFCPEAKRIFMNSCMVRLRGARIENEGSARRIPG